MNGNEIKAIPRTNERRIYVTIALVFFTVLFAYRVALFSDIEPRSDQAFFSWWVQGIVQTDHVIPVQQIGEGFMAALERDDESFLHRLLRPIHGKSVTIFTSVPLALRLIAAWIFGDGIEIQTISSILAATLTVLAIGLFPLWCFRNQKGVISPKQINGMALLSVIVAGCAYYSHYFSPLGNHNFGVLSLIIASGATQRAICSLEGQFHGNRRVILIAALFQFLALYSHWTNIFILCAATLLVSVLSNISLRRKFVVAGSYLTFLLIIIAPFLLFAVNDLGHAGNARNHTAWDLFYLVFSSGRVDLGAQSIRWFDNISSIFSVFGMILGLFGVFGLAAFQRMYIPLGLCVIHFVAAIFLPLFIGAHFRTDLYILPFLALGIAYIGVLSVSVIKKFCQYRKGSKLSLIAVLMIAFLTHHLWLQISNSGPPELIQYKNSEFWEMYYKGQGDIRPIAEEINRILPENAAIFTWGYGMQFFLRNYGVERSGRSVLPTLLTLLSRFDDGSLPDLIKLRSFSIPSGTPIFTLIDHAVDHVDRESVRVGIEKILGQSGLKLAKNVTLELKAKRELTSSWPQNIVLYRIHMK